MENFISTLIQNWGPTITAVFATIVMIGAVLGKVKSVISIFKKENAAEIAALKDKIAALITDNKNLAQNNETLAAAFSKLYAKIDELVRSDEFLAHREKADLTEFKELVVRLNTLYSNIMAEKGAVATENAETTEG